MDPTAYLAKYILDPIATSRDRSNRPSILAELEASQFYTPDRLQSMQRERLKTLLVHADANCPFYRERFERFGFNPEECQSIDDLAVVPVIRKADIQQHADRMKAQNIPTDRLVVNQTGGSTGAPLRFYHDIDLLHRRQAATYRHDRWAGWDIGQKMAVLWGNRVDMGTEPSLRSRLRTRLYDRRMILDTSNISRDKLADFADQLRSFRPPVYLAYANSMFLYARFLRENRITDYHRPHAIITSAELLTSDQRALIEDVFACRVFNRYGCREHSIIASECAEHSGMHMVAEHLLVEILKPADGSPDIPGRIVITDLFNFGMPLIRYQIEDLGEFVPGSCACGRGLPRLNIVGGRVTDFLVTPDSRVISGASMTIYFVATVPGVAQAQIIQKTRDHLILKVVPNNKFDDNSLRVIAEKVREFFGPTMKYEVEKVVSIPSTASGKHLFSICELDPMEFLT
ncbi:MAG: phenylacetate--CoA ligase family protein [candidate division Zixibacteria bacterium]|nr:phenylacetate--CoA ligase family protein [candidate division Zixibacteria bacterium]